MGSSTLLLATTLVFPFFYLTNGIFCHCKKNGLSHKQPLSTRHCIQHSTCLLLLVPLESVILLSWMACTPTVYQGTPAMTQRAASKQLVNPSSVHPQDAAWTSIINPTCLHFNVMICEFFLPDCEDRLGHDHVWLIPLETEIGIW